METHIPKLSWDQYFLRLAYSVAQRSECLDKQVGCVIVDKFKRVIGTGYNGFPAGAKNPCEHACIKEQGKPCGMVHAELNAMLYTDMSRADAMYLTLPPCADCLKHIRNTPVNTIVLPEAFRDSPKVQELAELKSKLAYFVDPGLSLDKKPSKSADLVEIFRLIKDYHEILGCPGKPASEQERYQKFRDVIVALNQELAELCDSFPWKPWRKIEDQERDDDNAVMEMVDIIFFMGSILELFEILPERLVKTFHSKLEENYNRIQRGYNKPKGDM